MTKKPATDSDRLQQFNFYTSREYYVELAEKIARTESGGRVVLMSLWLDARYTEIQNIIDAAGAAAKRGVKVTVILDAFTLLIKRGLIPGPAFFFGSDPAIVPEQFRERIAPLEGLRKAGVECVIIHQPKRPLANPFMGRSHIKFSVVDDEVFIGGCNLSEAHFLDIMVSWQDKKLAGWLENFAADVITSGKVSKAVAEDLKIPIDSKTSLLLDSGRASQSIIFDEALKLIDRAQKTIFISYQYFPHGIIAEHLEKAHKRGVALQVVYNHYSKHHPPLDMVYGLTAWKARQQKSAPLFEGRLPKDHDYVHGKLIASEHEAIVGSHNYMPSGVKWGTAEIAMISHDPAFAKKATATLKSQIKQA